MKKLKFLLFILPFFTISNVFAVSKDVTNDILYNPDNPSGTYKGDEILIGGYNGKFDVKTRYNGRLSLVEFYLPTSSFNFKTNTSYTITLNMATNDWRNNFMGPQVIKANSNGSLITTNGSLSVNNFQFISRKSIKFNFKTNSSISPYFFFRLYSTDYASTNNIAITGDNNWNLSSIIISDVSTSGGGTTTPSGPSTTFDDTAIINNQKENTQDIIDNQNTNTTNIIENNNDNTQNIINNQNENNEQILNGIDSVNQQLGTCYKNLLSFSDLFPAYNTYIQGKTFKQIEADVPGLAPGSGTGLKLQLYDSSNNLIDTISSSDHLSVARFNFFFTNTSDIYKVEFGVNGSVRDTKVGFYTSDLNLDTNSSYTLSFSILSALQGNITFSNFSLIKGNYNSNVFIDYGKSICTSKLDDVNNSIDIASGAITGAFRGGISDVINNQNQNSQQQIDSQKVCSKIDKNSISQNNVALSSVGETFNNNSFGVTNYISISKNDDLKILLNLPSNSSISGYYCFYNVNKTNISCNSVKGASLGSVTIPDNTSFVRFSINKELDRPQFEICKNGNQALQDSLTDSNVDNDVGTGFFDNFTSQDFGLSQIISIPLNTIQSLTSKSCVPLQIPIPFTNSNVTLPCMTEIYEAKFSTIYNLWKIVSFGIVAYLIAIDIFHIVKGFKDPESDKVEVLDL